MKTLYAIFAFGFMSCGLSTSQDRNAINDSITNDNRNFQNKITKPKSASDDKYANYIDNHLINFIDTAHRNWKIPAPNRWDTLWFNQYKNESNLVYYAPGDFDCNNNKDYVLILKKSNGSLAAFAFLSKGQSFQIFELLDLGEDKDEFIEYGLETLPPGKYNYMDPDSNDAPSVTINCNAIQILNFEKGAETFYWEKGKLKSIMTGD